MEESRVEIFPGPLKNDLQEMVESFSVLFPDKLPESASNLQSFEIELKPDFPVRPIPPRRVSPALREMVRAEIAVLLESGIIRPSRSAFSSPIVMVRKKDGTRRMCLDYRRLNEATVDNKRPLPQVKEVLSRLGGAKYYATLDLRSGFHQVPMAEESIKYTAFATEDGLYEYTRLPFGLKNAPAHFQRQMSELLSSMRGCGAEVFIDDIVVYGEDEQTFMKRLRVVFELLKENNICLKNTKCKLGFESLEHLGHIVSGEGITLSEERKSAIRNLMVP